MKKFFLVALVAMLGTVNAVAQTALSFTGDRAIVKKAGKHYIPQSVWNSNQTLYLDLVNSIEPEIGFENWIGENSWSVEAGSQWIGNTEAIKKQYIKVDVPGLWTNMYSGNAVSIYVRRIADPTLTVGGVSKLLSQWSYPISMEGSATLTVDNFFSDKYNRLFLNGTEIDRNKTIYTLTQGGNYELRTVSHSSVDMHTVAFQLQSASIAVTGVSLNTTSLTKTVGDPAETLVATITPSSATNKNVSWSTSNASVATVSNGVVNFVGVGTATIMVTTADGNKTATCAVTVKAATIAVTGVSLNKTTTTMTVGGEETLVATVNPDNATNKNVSWSSSNTTVATVDGMGKVKALSAGTTTIMVTTADGNKTATCAVTVKAATIAVTGVSLNKTTTTMTVGGEETLVATVNPDNATNKNVSWSSSNTTVASIDGTGKIKALSAGTATITVTTEDGDKTATCNVTVESAIDYSWLTQPTIECIVTGTTLEVKAVGPTAESFNKVTVNGTEISKTGEKWIIDISSTGVREIKMSNNAGVILSRTHQKGKEQGKKQK